MKKLLAALLALHWAFVPAYAQNAITLPIAAQAVADIGNGPIKVRVTAGNASIFTAQGSGVGSTSGSSTTLALAATPLTIPIVGGIISGTGITSGTTVAAYSGTSITLSAAMTVPASTAVSWGAACPASAAGIPSQRIQASAMADYFLLYTQARICAISPGGPVNTLLILPVFYDSTTAGGGGSGAVSSVFGRTGAVVATASDYNFNQLAGAAACAQLPALTGDITSAACATTLATVNANVGSFGSSTQCVTVTANGKGLITAVSAATCAPAFSSVTGLLALNQIANINANTVLSNWTAGATAPTANVWPACANDGAHALVYINGTGLQCGTITAGGITTITAATGITLSSGATCTTTCTVSAGIVNGGTAITGGTNGRLLYDNLGFVGEATPATGLTLSGGQLQVNAGNAFGAPYFSVSLAANQSFSASTWTKANFDTVALDTGSYWSASNHNYKPLVAGTYAVTACANHTATYVAGSSAYVSLSKNGIQGGGGSPVATNQLNAGGAQTVIGLCAAGIVALNGSTDTIEVDVFDSGTAPSLQGSAAVLYTNFSGYRIGP